MCKIGKYFIAENFALKWISSFALELFGIKETLLENKTLLRSLFINFFDTAVNANDVFSLAEEGTFRRSVEEKMLDHLQSRERAGEIIKNIRKRGDAF